MSQIQQSTTYQVSIYAQDPAGGSAEFAFSVPATADFGDAQAFALIDGIAAAFPSSFTVTKSVSKAQDTYTGYVTDYGSTPPSFQ